MPTTDQTFNTVAKDPADRQRLLRIFLADHLALTTAAVELAKRTRRENAGTPLESDLRSLADGLQQERDELSRLAQRVGATPGIAKRALAWLGEKLGRLKSNGRRFGYSPLSRVYELEALLALAYPRKVMWQALASAYDEEGLPRDVVFQTHGERAEWRLAELERWMLDAARAAL